MVEFVVCQPKNPGGKTQSCWVPAGLYYFNLFYTPCKGRLLSLIKRDAPSWKLINRSTPNPRFNNFSGNPFPEASEEKTPKFMNDWKRVVSFWDMAYFQSFIFRCFSCWFGGCLPNRKVVSKAPIFRCYMLVSGRVIIYVTLWRSPTESFQTATNWKQQIFPVSQIRFGDKSLRAKLVMIWRQNNISI